MAASPILTLGLGAFGSPGLLLTLGYQSREELPVSARAATYLPVHGADPRIITVYGVDIRPLDVTGTSPVPREVKG